MTRNLNQLFTSRPFSYPIAILPCNVPTRFLSDVCGTENYTLTLYVINNRIVKATISAKYIENIVNDNMCHRRYNTPTPLGSIANTASVSGHGRHFTPHDYFGTAHAR